MQYTKEILNLKFNNFSNFLEIEQQSIFVVMKTTEVVITLYPKWQLFKGFDTNTKAKISLRKKKAKFMLQ